MNAAGTSTASLPPGARAYWLWLSALFGFALVFTATTDRIWLWAVYPAVVVGVFAVARMSGQLDAWAHGRSVPAPAVVVALIFGAAAVQLHTAGANGWIGTGLGAAGFAAMFALLTRYGRYEDPRQPKRSP